MPEGSIRKTRVQCFAIINNSSGKFLVLRRVDDDVDKPGEWDLPGGKVEFGEDPKDSIVREIKEETGIDNANVVLATIVSYAYEKPDKKVHLIKPYYRCSVDDDIAITLNSKEHKDYKWVSKSDFLAMGFPDYVNELVSTSFSSTIKPLNPRR